MRKERLLAKRYLVYEITWQFSREFQKYLSISTPRRKEGLINGFLRDNGGSPLKKAFFPESVNEKGNSPKTTMKPEHDSVAGRKTIFQTFVFRFHPHFLVCT